MLLLLLACTSPAPSDDSVDPPTLAWLSPHADARLPEGEVSCAVIIESFTLHDPAKHNSGVPIGHVRIAMDGDEVLLSGQTTFSLSFAAGPHTLEATLLYADGDAVFASPDQLCEEESEECGPVRAEVSVEVE